VSERLAFETFEDRKAWLNDSDAEAEADSSEESATP
jgi:hypothetical protein